MKDVKESLVEAKERIVSAIRKLSLDEKESELDLLEEETANADFWNDKDNAKLITEKINLLKNIVLPWRELEKEATGLLSLSNEISSDDSMASEISKKTAELLEKLEVMEIQTYFSGKYDKENAVLSVFAGAGGVDAQDWAEMLLSMFLKYAEKLNFKTKIIHLTPGAEAGIKSASIEITGHNAYGTLRGEGGVHRLVRISPYDADKSRHTSFALVEVIPELESKGLNVPDKDLRIETFRASGHGGQSVNTTDSAVRITHIPTNTVVTCQNERSQIQNRETALKVLMSRLAILLEAKREKELRIIKGDSLPAEWGSQIRSYVIHPYQMVKDHRTGEETSDVNKVLAGDLSEFTYAYLKNPKI